MKKTKLLLLLPLVISLAACNTNGDASSGVTEPTNVPTSGSSSTEPEPPAPEKKSVKVRIPAITTSNYYIDVNYDDDYFDQKSNVFTKELNLLSFAANCVTDKKDEAYAFFNTMGYDNFFDSGYDAITKDSIGYVLAHKAFENYDVVAVAIRGHNYGKEWINNFTVGKEGNHVGFDAKANEIYDKLVEYVSSFGNKTIKLWIDGYSRGGAVANVLASKLLKERDEIQVEKDNIFVYTYEAPRALTEENAVKYDNVFNIVNDMDLIPRLLPQEYGLYRCGIDINIEKDKDVDKAVKDLNIGYELPKFTPKPDTGVPYTNECELLDQLITNLLAEMETAQDVSIATREKYVDNMEPTITYLIGFFLDLPQSVTLALLASVSSLSEDELKTLFMQILFTDNAIYTNVLKPVFDAVGYKYDEETLSPNCATAERFLKSKFNIIASFIDTQAMALDQEAVANVQRVIAMHYPEVVYALIK